MELCSDDRSEKGIDNDSEDGDSGDDGLGEKGTILCFGKCGAKIIEDVDEYVPGQGMHNYCNDCNKRIVDRILETAPDNAPETQISDEGANMAKLCTKPIFVGEGSWAICTKETSANVQLFFSAKQTPAIISAWGQGLECDTLLSKHPPQNPAATHYFDDNNGLILGVKHHAPLAGTPADSERFLAIFVASLTFVPTQTNNPPQLNQKDALENWKRAVLIELVEQCRLFLPPGIQRLIEANSFSFTKLPEGNPTTTTGCATSEAEIYFEAKFVGVPALVNETPQYSGAQELGEPGSGNVPTPPPITLTPPPAQQKWGGLRLP